MCLPMPRLYRHRQGNRIISQWWQRYRGAARKAQIAIGCGTVLGLCMVCGGVSAAIGPQAPVTHPTATTGRIAQQSTQAPATESTAATEPTATATPKPIATATAIPPTPTSPPPPPPTTAPTCTGVNGNPWCFDFNPGNLIYQANTPSAFCNYFHCIGNFFGEPGYIVECSDGTYSHAGGISGSCSRHGGNLRPLYSH